MALLLALLGFSRRGALAGGASVLRVGGGAAIPSDWARSRPRSLPPATALGVDAPTAMALVLLRRLRQRTVDLPWVWLTKWSWPMEESTPTPPVKSGHLPHALRVTSTCAVATHLAVDNDRVDSYEWRKMWWPSLRASRTAILAI